MSIVLASGSPRRRELLELLRVPELLIIPAVRDENAPEGLSPAETVEALSSAKAAEVAEQRPREDVIIAADTVVWHGGRILGKPHTESEACEMLKSLSGDEHEVYTGVTVRRGEVVITEHEVSAVRFRNLSEDEIHAYVATGEPMDKAGAYGAQGFGALLVEGIRGDFFNVMGLPLCRLGQMLERLDVRLI